MIKKNLILIFALLFSFGIRAKDLKQSKSYAFRFANHTNKNILIGLKLAGVGEDQKDKIVAPGKSITFGEKNPLCLREVFYVKEPENMKDPKNPPYREANIKIIPSGIYGEIIDAAKELANTGRNVVKTIGGGVKQYIGKMTESERQKRLEELKIEAKKQILKEQGQTEADLKEMNVEELNRFEREVEERAELLLEREMGEKPKPTTGKEKDLDRLKIALDSIGKVDVGNIIDGIAKLTDLPCPPRHFDIIEDGDGEIEILVLGTGEAE